MMLTWYFLVFLVVKHLNLALEMPARTQPADQRAVRPLSLIHI